MTDPADLEALARRYLDLWQDQMSALAGDPDFMAAMDKLTAATGVSVPGGAAAWTAWPGMMSMMMAAAQGPANQGPANQGPANLDPASQDPEVRDRNVENGQTSDAPQNGGREPAAPAGASALAAPSGLGPPELAELLDRLAALEKRIAALESGAGAGGRGARREPGEGRA